MYKGKDTIRKKIEEKNPSSPFSLDDGNDGWREGGARSKAQRCGECMIRGMDEGVEREQVG